jgi:hypothetical protein
MKCSDLLLPHASSFERCCVSRSPHVTEQSLLFISAVAELLINLTVAYLPLVLCLNWQSIASLQLCAGDCRIGTAFLFLKAKINSSAEPNSVKCCVTVALFKLERRVGTL